jgi:hypothetical protein
MEVTNISGYLKFVLFMKSVCNKVVKDVCVIEGREENSKL